MIKLPWKYEARPLEPRLKVNPWLAELPDSQADPRRGLPRQALGRGGDIQMRLEEKNWNKESWLEEEEPWPREFCPVE